MKPSSPARNIQSRPGMKKRNSPTVRRCSVFNNRFRPPLHSGSENLPRFAETGGIRGDPSTGLAGIFHCCHLFLTHMVDADISHVAVRARDCFLGGIAEMTGVICHRSAVFACVCHHESPCGERKVRELYARDSSRGLCTLMGIWPACKPSAILEETSSRKAAEASLRLK
jgi:hypothetical protein